MARKPPARTLGRTAAGGRRRFPGMAGISKLADNRLGGCARSAAACGAAPEQAVPPAASPPTLDSASGQRPSASPAGFAGSSGVSFLGPRYMEMRRPHGGIFTMIHGLKTKDHFWIRAVRMG